MPDKQPTPPVRRTDRLTVESAPNYALYLKYTWIDEQSKNEELTRIYTLPDEYGEITDEPR